MLRVWVGPAGVRAFVRDAVVAGGGIIVDDASAADAIVWTAPAVPVGLRRTLDGAPQVRWVQLPWAGIEQYRDILDHRLWTTGQGVYADDVAEHVLALTLACLRDLKARATAVAWQAPSGRSLRGARVVVFGAGGIASSLSALLAPFAVELTVVRRRPDPCAFAERTLALGAAVAGRLSDDVRVALGAADVVVLALALTPQTRGLADDAFFSAMKPGATFINVARGAHVDTDALLRALATGHVAAAGVDVTDPEPLPGGHPLFQAPGCIVTPHCANTPQMAEPVLRARVTDNVRRFIAGEPMLGVVDRDAGY